MNGGIGCHGTADRQNTEEREEESKNFDLQKQNFGYF